MNRIAKLIVCVMMVAAILMGCGGNGAGGKKQLNVDERLQQIAQLDKGNQPDDNYGVWYEIFV